MGEHDRTFADAISELSAFGLVVWLNREIGASLEIGQKMGRDWLYVRFPYPIPGDPSVAWRTLHRTMLPHRDTIIAMIRELGSERLEPGTITEWGGTFD